MQLCRTCLMYPQITGVVSFPSWLWDRPALCTKVSFLNLSPTCCLDFVSLLSLVFKDMDPPSWSVSSAWGLSICPLSFLLQSSLLALGLSPFCVPHLVLERRLPLNCFLPGFVHTWVPLVLSPFQPPAPNQGYSYTCNSHCTHSCADGKQSAYLGLIPSSPTTPKDDDLLGSRLLILEIRDQFAGSCSYLSYWPWGKYLLSFLESMEF